MMDTMQKDSVHPASSFETVKLLLFTSIPDLDSGSAPEERSPNSVLVTRELWTVAPQSSEWQMRSPMSDGNHLCRHGLAEPVSNPLLHLGRNHSSFPFGRHLPQHNPKCLCSTGGRPSSPELQVTENCLLHQCVSSSPGRLQLWSHLLFLGMEVTEGPETSGDDINKWLICGC